MYCTTKKYRPHVGYEGPFTYADGGRKRVTPGVSSAFFREKANPLRKPCMFFSSGGGGGGRGMRSNAVQQYEYRWPSLSVARPLLNAALTH